MYGSTIPSQRQIQRPHVSAVSPTQYPKARQIHVSERYEGAVSIVLVVVFPEGKGFWDFFLPEIGSKDSDFLSIFFLLAEGIKCVAQEKNSKQEDKAQEASQK